LRLDQVELAGDAERLDDWLGAHHLPITVRAGTPAVTGVVLAGAGGRMVIPGSG
jgi:hypothetical protein